MKLSASLLALFLLPSAALADAAALAPTGTLRAVYLANNPAQAVRDGASGEIRGASADLARELGKRLNVPVAITPSASPQTVIDTVAKGEADIGFVAYAPSRTGTVEFSQTYMLVRQSFLVPEASALKSVNDIDKSGLRISGGKGDSVTLFLARTLKAATLVETDNTPADTKRKFDAARDRCLRREPPAADQHDEGHAGLPDFARQRVRRAANHHRREGQREGACDGQRV